jgi:TetR/AcrR family transcriptional regulator
MTNAKAAPVAGGRPRRGRIREANETAILKAAEEVFAEAGFGGATTAAIAERAGIAKANLHYYFGTKLALYREVLRGVLEMWLAASDPITAEAEPGDALRRYITDKVELSRTRPSASKVFANEILHGARHIRPFLEGELRRRLAEKTAVIEGWIAAGKMRRVDPTHLFFMLWAATQTYADFDVQMSAVLGRRKLERADYERGAETILRIVLHGCGVEASAAEAESAGVSGPRRRRAR